MRLIDADALIDDCMNRYCENCEKRRGIKNGKWKIVYQIGEAPCRACDVDDMFGDLENAPTIDAVPVVHGEWIIDALGVQVDECGIAYTKYAPRCSKCGLHFDAESNYCPNCGAKMDLTQSNDSNVLDALDRKEQSDE